MTTDHYKVIQALATLGQFYSPWEGQFIHSLKHLPQEAELTDRQVEQVECMAIKFRRVLNRCGYPVPRSILGPYFERVRNQRTPDNTKYHWVMEPQS